MTKKASPYEQVIQALPAVSEAVRAKITQRLIAGETVAYVEDDHVVASRPATRDLSARRKELLEEFSCQHQAGPRSRSAA